MFVPSLLLIKETRSRLRDLKSGLCSLVFLPVTIGGLAAFVLLAVNAFSKMPILNWSWLGYNIALGPFASTGVMGILPFVPLLVYMLLPLGFLYQRIYFKRGLNHAYALHFVTNLGVVGMALGAFFLLQQG